MTIVNTSPIIYIGEPVNTGTSQYLLYVDSNGLLAQEQVIAVTQGGTGLATCARGDIFYASNTNIISALARDLTPNKYLQTGAVPSWAQVDLTNGVTGALPIANAGTNITTYTQGDLLYCSATNVLSKLAKNITASRYLSNQGGTNNPAWNAIDLTNGVTGVLPEANGGTNQTIRFTTNVKLITQSADIAATNFTNGTQKGTYRVSYLLLDTAADVTAGVVTLTIAFTDDAGATTVTANQTLTGLGRSSGSIYLSQNVASTLTYATTHTGIFGTATYALYLCCERLS